MLRLVLLLFCILQAYVNANNDVDGEVVKILQKLNTNPSTEKVYKRADLIYAEFKASESLIDADWGLFFKLFLNAYCQEDVGCVHLYEFILFLGGQDGKRGWRSSEIPEEKLRRRGV